MPRSLPSTALAVALTAAGSVHAIGLDEIAQQSGLGEPLRLVIPVLSSADEPLGSDEFAGECFKLVAPMAGDLPGLDSARVALEHRGGRAFVVLTTQQPINEPIMRIAVQAGCRATVSREYTVLLDPVTIEPPIAEKSATPVAAAMAAPAAMARGDAVAAVEPEAQRGLPAASPRRHAVRSAGNKPNGTLGQSAHVASPSLPTPRAAPASTRPRLQVSRTEGASSAPRSNRPQTSATEGEALRTIEEQTVVLQRQIAELSVAMERMERDLVAARAAKAEAEANALAAAERASTVASSSSATMRTWAGLNWPLLVLTPAAIVLLAAALHRRRPIVVPAPITPAQAAAFNRADLGEPSVPGPEPMGDEESVVTPMAISGPARVVRPVLVDPPTSAVPEFTPDAGIAFDDEVRQTAEAACAYSILEREQPGIVGRLTESWGTPRVAGQLENYLLAPRSTGRKLSRAAVEELSLLRSIALERAGFGANMLTPRAREGNGRLKLGGSST